jgi:hypothetical protein
MCSLYLIFSGHGQTGLPLKIRYKEHIRSIRYNKEDSGFSTYILRNIHSYGKIEDIVEKIYHAGKGYVMNIKGNFYIYVYAQNRKLMDEQRTNEDNHRNILFDVAMTYIDMPHT